MSKICPACSHENPDGALFCKECGTPLPEESSYQALWYIQDQGEMRAIREEELIELIKSGALSAESSIWSDGMSDWQSIKNTSLSLYLPDETALSTSTSFSSILSTDTSRAPALDMSLNEANLDAETTAKMAAREPYIEPLEDVPDYPFQDTGSGTIRGAVFYQDPISASREHKVLSRRAARAQSGNSDYSSNNTSNGLGDLASAVQTQQGPRVSTGKTAEQIREEELFSQPALSTQQMKVREKQEREARKTPREKSLEIPYMPLVFEMIEMAALLFLIVGSLLFFLTGGYNSNARLWSLVLTVIAFVYILSVPITNSVFISYFKRHTLPRSYKSLATGQIVLNIVPVVLLLLLYFLMPGFLAELLALL